MIPEELPEFQPEEEDTAEEAMVPDDQPEYAPEEETEALSEE